MPKAKLPTKAAAERPNLFRTKERLRPAVSHDTRYFLIPKIQIANSIRPSVSA